MNGRVAVVTGGARGIGAATARLLAARGAEAVVADRTPPGIPTDVTDASQVRRLFETVKERYGRLDVLIVNAGKPFTSTSLEAGETEWNECLDLNLKAAWYCARKAYPLLRETGRGSIVVVSSLQGVFGGRRTFPYSAAKAGLLGLARSLAVEYAPEVRVNAIIPGQIESVRTEAHFAAFPDPAEARRRTERAYPMQRLGKPEDVAHAAVFLASDEAAWITGAFLMVDGGWSAALE